MVPMVVAAAMDIPIVNGDGMGRAFPELQMITYLIYGGSPYPAAIADERGSQVVIAEVPDASGSSALHGLPLSRWARTPGWRQPSWTARTAVARLSPTHCGWPANSGTRLHHAREVKDDPAEAILGVAGGMRYLRGKVTDVHRRNAAGFARGQMTVAGIGDDAGRSIRIDFQNENLAIYEDDEPKVMVPDLITLVTSDTGEPITTELLRFGVRADVLVLPAPDLLRTPEALAVVGPHAFGIDADYEPAV